MNKLRGIGYVNNQEAREQTYPKAPEDNAKLPLKSTTTEIIALTDTKSISEQDMCREAPRLVLYTSEDLIANFG